MWHHADPEIQVAVQVSGTNKAMLVISAPPMLTRRSMAAKLVDKTKALIVTISPKPS